MAAKKSIPKKSAAHADGRQRTGPPERTRSRRHRAARPRAPCSCARSEGAPGHRPSRDPGELIGRLSEGLALLETIGMALREFESQPTLGSICVAFNQAVIVIRRAHSDVGHFLEHGPA
jgi:hypothetical protein